MKKLFSPTDGIGLSCGNVSKLTEVHDQYPQLDAFQTEHLGGTWIANQQRTGAANQKWQPR